MNFSTLTANFHELQVSYDFPVTLAATIRTIGKTYIKKKKKKKQYSNFMNFIAEFNEFQEFNSVMTRNAVSTQQIR